MFDTDLIPDEEVACTVCSGGHDEDIHEATVRIHLWLRQQVTRFWEEEVTLDDDPVEFFLVEDSAA